MLHMSMRVYLSFQRSYTTWRSHREIDTRMCVSLSRVYLSLCVSISLCACLSLYVFALLLCTLAVPLSIQMCPCSFCMSISPRWPIFLRALSASLSLSLSLSLFFLHISHSSCVCMLPFLRLSHCSCSFYMPLTLHACPSRMCPFSTCHSL